MFAVFDRDDHQSHQSYNDALVCAQSLDGKIKNDNKQLVEFKAIASIPCFELWLLLHFEDIQHLLHRDEVIDRLKKYLPQYEKGLDGCFDMTRSNRKIASDRAKRLTERSNAHNDKEPYTTVHELVNLLEKLGG